MATFINVSPVVSESLSENDIKKLDCTTDTIDLYVIKNNIKKIDFIKCDVEGSELFVFQGGIESIKKYSPVIFTEMLRKWALKFNYHPNDIINLFKNIGYNCYYSSSGSLKPIDIVTEDTIPTNFFFLHPDVHANLISINL